MDGSKPECGEAGWEAPIAIRGGRGRQGLGLGKSMTWFP